MKLSLRKLKLKLLRKRVNKLRLPEYQDSFKARARLLGLKLGLKLGLGLEKGFRSSWSPIHLLLKS